MKEVIDSGELGALKTLIIYGNHSLFNGSSHQFDLILRLNSDRRALWASAHITDDDSIFDGDIVREDPNGQGMIQFENGVTAHALLSPRGSEWEAICERGIVTCWNNGWQWHLRRQAEVPGWRSCFVPETFPEFEHTSSTANLIKDLVHSLDTGEPSRCGVRVAHASTELIFAFMESHLQNGARVQLPLKGQSCGWRESGPQGNRGLSRGTRQVSQNYIHASTKSFGHVDNVLEFVIVRAIMAMCYLGNIKPTKRQFLC